MMTLHMWSIWTRSELSRTSVQPALFSICWTRALYFLYSNELVYFLGTAVVVCGILSRGRKKIVHSYATTHRMIGMVALSLSRRSYVYIASR
jgi:hypothetical protein